MNRIFSVTYQCLFNVSLHESHFQYEIPMIYDVCVSRTAIVTYQWSVLMCACMNWMFIVTYH